MQLKKKKSRLAWLVIPFLVLVASIEFNSRDIRIEIHSVSEWILSQDLGFSSFFNVIDDGSLEYRGNYTQPVASKLISVFQRPLEIFNYKFISKRDVDIPALFIDIAFEDYESLLNDRDQAVAMGHAIQLDFQEVKADLIIDGNKKKVKISLKGLLDTHWLVKRRMSLKIKVLDDETVMNFKEFSIQKPRERQWPYNYINEHLSSKLGILSTNTKPVRVFLNGEKWGVMLAEESIGKTFLENKERLNSLIFKFGDERIWFEGWSADPLNLYRISDSSVVYKIYNGKKFLVNDQNMLNRKRMSYVLQEKIKHSTELFDAELMNKAFMLASAWGTYHNLLNNNTSYYLNPYDLQLEPITRDQYPIQPITNKELVEQWPPPIQFLIALKNSEFKVNAKKNFDLIASEIPESQEQLNSANKIFPLDSAKSLNIFANNINQILINKEDWIDFDPNKFYQLRDYGVTLDTHQLSDLKRFDSINDSQNKRLTDLVHIKHFINGEIEIINLIPDSVSINEIIFKGRNIITEPIILESYLDVPAPLIIKSGVTGLQDGQFILEASYMDKSSSVVNGNSLIRNIVNPLEQSTDIPNFIIRENSSWLIKQGSWDILNSLVIHGNLFIEPGVRLNFAKDASLIIQGNITAKGTKKSPIYMQPIDESWGGLYVYNASKLSELSNVVIKNTSGVNKGILSLTGGTVFYASNVNLTDVLFEGTIAEDALNIINSKYFIGSTSFEKTRSDAFDSDYSNGEINNIDFSDVGGDGLDLSGSEVIVNNFRAINVKDKAISAGEKSILYIQDFYAKNVGVAIASKDGSSTFAEMCVISNVELMPFMTYVKKNNYDAPSLSLTKCSMKKAIYSVDEIYFRQKGTLLTSDEEENIISRDLDVELLYQTDVMKK